MNEPVKLEGVPSGRPVAYLPPVFARYWTAEAFLLFAAVLVVLAGVPLALRLSPWWALGLSLGFVLFGFDPLLARAQDRALEWHLAAGRFTQALKLAAAIRNSAHKPRARDLAEFDVGLVHLARGAPADAARSFASIQVHRLTEPMRLLVKLYHAIAVLRARASDDDLSEFATAALAKAREAEGALGEDAQLLACEGEALLALGESASAFDRLARSLEMDPNPRDPTPGERHLSFARAALATGQRETAVKALRVASKLSGEPPFVRAARAELDRLEHAS